MPGLCGQEEAANRRVSSSSQCFGGWPGVGAGVALS